MASKRFEEFLKNASPELKGKIAEAGKEALTLDSVKNDPPSIKNDQPIKGDLRPIDRKAELSRPYAAPPTPSHGPSEKPNAVDRAMAKETTAQAPSQDKQKDKELER